MGYSYYSGVPSGPSTVWIGRGCGAFGLWFLFPSAVAEFLVAFAGVLGIAREPEAIFELRIRSTGLVQFDPAFLEISAACDRRDEWNRQKSDAHPAPNSTCTVRWVVLHHFKYTHEIYNGSRGISGPALWGGGTKPGSV